MNEELIRSQLPHFDQFSVLGTMNKILILMVKHDCAFATSFRTSDTLIPNRKAAKNCDKRFASCLSYLPFDCLWGFGFLIIADFLHMLLAKVGLVYALGMVWGGCREEVV